MNRLPSCDSWNPRAQSVTNDAAFIKQNLLKPSIDSGKRIVLITHSYSGGPGGMAAKGLSITERRAAGLPGGIIGLVFISAFLAKQGQSLISGSGGNIALQNNGQLGVRDPKQWFFHDVPDRYSDFAAAQLKNQSRYSAETPCGAPAWFDTAYNGRRSFARCALDRAIPPVAQDLMVQQSGVQWNVENFHSGHAPFLSQPKRLSDWVVSQVARWDTGNEIVRPESGTSVSSE
ncbi:MAG: hypothetical protein Q9188_003612 [Gyalolechia gomerana]